MSLLRGVGLDKQPMLVFMSSCCPPSVESTFGRISGPVISEGVDISGIPSIFKHAFLGGEFSELFGTGQSIVPILHRYFISVARVVVDMDGKGGAAADLVIWCAGSSREKVSTECAVRVLAWLPEPSHSLDT